MDKDEIKTFIKMLECLLDREDLIELIRKDYGGTPVQIRTIVKALCYDLTKASK